MSVTEKHKEIDGIKENISLTKKRWGHLHTEESKKKMSEKAKLIKHKPTQGYQKGHGLLGNNPTSKGKKWKWTEEAKVNFSENYRGDKHHSKGKNGEEHPRWIKDRTLVKGRENRKSSEYYNWRSNIKIRDNYECKLKNNECSGRLEVHHIFSFTRYPELRYLLTNGITLCKYHHPLKKDEEQRMIPIFQELISNIQ